MENPEWFLRRYRGLLFLVNCCSNWWKPFCVTRLYGIRTWTSGHRLQGKRDLALAGFIVIKKREFTRRSHDQYFRLVISILKFNDHRISPTWTTQQRITIAIHSSIFLFLTPNREWISSLFNSVVRWIATFTAFFCFSRTIRDIQTFSIDSFAVISSANTNKISFCALSFDLSETRFSISIAAKHSKMSNSQVGWLSCN
jgi:hypothetical protein